MGVMRHFKFLGGPWDGDYKQMDGREYVDVMYPSRLRPFAVRVASESERDPLKVCRYKLKRFGDNDTGISFYVDSQWENMYTFGQLIHHYNGRP